MKNFFFYLLIIFCLVDCASADFFDSDLNQDGIVDYLDLQMLGNFWFDDCYQSPCYNIDTKENGQIDFYDLTALSGNWKITDHNSYQVAYWPLSESSGTTAHDATANSHNALLKPTSNPPVWTSGKRQGALQFDGINDYLSISEVSNGMGKYFKRDFSIAMWINQSSPQSDYQVPIGIESTNAFVASGFEGFTIEIYNGVPSVYIAYADDQREIVPAATVLTANQWQHLCVVRSGAVLKIYINGKLNISQTIADADIKFGSAWPGYDVIGATKDIYYGLTCPFKGKLDDIHLYNFAIPETLIHKLAQQDYAWLPAPEDGYANISVDSNLSWQKGVWPRDYNCHDVYVGTDYNQVFLADINTAVIYQGRQTSRLFDPGGLNSNTLYYWRVDDVNASQIHKGSVWSFETSDNVSSIEVSSSQPDFGPGGAYDGHRYEASVGNCWKGAAGQSSWTWQVNFSIPRQIGSILMIMGEPGDNSDKMRYTQRNSPSNYKWQYSDDGTTWYDIDETIITGDKRIFRILRLDTAIIANHLRLVVYGCVGDYPTIREIELYDNTDANIAFEDWLVAVDITNEPGPPYGNTEWFIELARRCSGWENVQGQQIWVGSFNEAFLNIEPYPLCMFISGSFDEWCQVTRSYFTGLQEVVLNGNIPIWGSCGGAQVLGLINEPGCQNPWDCPRCRYVHSPAWSPIYRHIGYLNPGIEPQACGDYSNCIYESGAYLIKQVVSDPVFAGLSDPFYALESHCGELAYLPSGWFQIGGKGPGTLTNLQCYRKVDRYIYGAQFHIENDYNSDTNSNAIKIMTNFLGVAQGWGGYNPP